METETAKRELVGCKVSWSHSLNERIPESFSMKTCAKVLRRRKVVLTLGTARSSAVCKESQLELVQLEVKSLRGKAMPGMFKHHKISSPKPQTPLNVNC